MAMLRSGHLRAMLPTQGAWAWPQRARSVLSLLEDIPMASTRSPHRDRPPMTEADAIAAARDVAAAEGWTWREPVVAKRERLGDSRVVWRVVTNAGSRGCSVRVVVEDGTAHVISKAFLPR